MKRNNSPNAMSEQQADYDTDTDDTQPTPGPWKVGRDGRTVVTTARYEQPNGLPATIAAVDYFPFPEEEANVNAKLIAAAGTATSELPDGWDAIDILEALPKLLRAANMAVNSTLFRDEDGRAHPPDRNHMLDLRDALAACRGDQADHEVPVSAGTHTVLVEVMEKERGAQHGICKNASDLLRLAGGRVEGDLATALYDLAHEIEEARSEE
jgi:hypothetical protein